jgi:hypothetical protein
LKKHYLTFLNTWMVKNWQIQLAVKKS